MIIKIYRLAQSQHRSYSQKLQFVIVTPALYGNDRTTNLPTFILCSNTAKTCKKKYRRVSKQYTIYKTIYTYCIICYHRILCTCKCSETCGSYGTVVAQRWDDMYVTMLKGGGGGFTERGTHPGMRAWLRTWTPYRKR